MGETIDQTRLEIAAQRAELEATAARLRDALDLRKRVRENPAVVIGIGAATVFLVVGGPRRLARLLRGTMAPHAAEEAYDALPETMQAWVDALAGEAGPKVARGARRAGRGAAPLASRPDQGQARRARSWRARWSRVRPGRSEPRGTPPRRR